VDGPGARHAARRGARADVGDARAVRAGEVLPLLVSPTGDSGYRGVRGADGWDTGSLYKRTQIGGVGFIVNSTGLLKFKAKLLTGFIKSQTKLPSCFGIKTGRGKT
jgi:hypothetical protein